MSDNLSQYKRHKNQTVWFKGIRAAGSTFGLNTSGGEVIRLTNVASAVDYLNVTPAAANGSVTIAAAGSDTDVALNINSQGLDTIRINSRTVTTATSGIIGFQSKPAQGVATANNVIGGEISPRVNDTFALTGSGSLIGLHVDAYLKGTTGNIAGDVRGQQIELVTDDAGTRTISGDVIGLRMRAAFSGTITGNMIAFSVEKAEAQTNSKQWEYLFELTGDNGLVWKDDYTTEVTTIAGAIKVFVNGQDRWIPLYSGAPSV